MHLEPPVGRVRRVLQVLGVPAATAVLSENRATRGLQVPLDKKEQEECPDPQEIPARSEPLDSLEQLVLQATLVLSEIPALLVSAAKPDLSETPAALGRLEKQVLPVKLDLLGRPDPLGRGVRLAPEFLAPVTQERLEQQERRGLLV